MTKLGMVRSRLYLELMYLSIQVGVYKCVTVRHELKLNHTKKESLRVGTGKRTEMPNIVM